LDLGCERACDFGRLKIAIAVLLAVVGLKELVFP